MSDEHKDRPDRSVLEQWAVELCSWLSTHSNLDKPVLIIDSGDWKGKSYTPRQIIQEIKDNTPLGKHVLELYIHDKLDIPND